MSSSSWIENGKCQVQGLDPNYFYPNGKQDAETGEEDAKNREQLQAERAKFCLGIIGGPVCPVKSICLELAVTHNEAGVWGGTTEFERRKLRKQRIRLRAAAKTA